MIDCKGLNLLGGSTPQTITGLYAKFKSAMKRNKPIYAYNCVYGEGVPMTPVQLMAIDEAGLLIGTASILQIRVTSEDSVTITNLDT